MEEKWVAVRGWEGWYEVSDLGRCRTIQRPYRGHPRNFKEEYPLLLTPLWYRKGYYKIQLGTCNGTREAKRLYLHRVVWEAFNGPIPSHLTVNHIDGSHDNNRLDNLELATQLEQNAHARALGLSRYRTKSGWRKSSMTADKVRELRRLRDKGWTQQSLADRYGIAQSNVTWILKGRTWSHVA